MNITRGLRRYSLAVGASLVLSVPVGTIISVKTSLFEDTELSMAIEEYQQQGICGSRPSRLEKRCTAQENTFYGLAVRAMSRITFPLFPLLGKKMPQPLEEVCEEVRRDQHYYREQLLQFFTHLDRDSTLRIKVEQAIYSSTGEISIDVLYQRGEYVITPKNDHSNALYHHYISILKGDEQLQKLLRQIADGENTQEEFLQRARDLVAAIRPSSSLERLVKGNLLQAFHDGVAQKRLAEWHELAAEDKKEEQKFLEVMPEPLATAEYREAAIAYKEWRKSFPQRFSQIVWIDLSTQLVYNRIARVEPAFNRELIAYGHTHPSAIDEKYQNDKESGPSPIDLQGPCTKPKLIFTPYADKWLIHQVICGESTLAREYPRSMKPQ